MPPALLFTLLSLICGPIAASGLTVGTVYLEVSCYHHPSRLNRWGKRCDLFNDCDPEFTFCFSRVHPTASKCDLKRLHYSFVNKNYLGKCNRYEPKNFPPLINFDVSLSNFDLFLTVTIMEVDDVSRNNLMDEIIFRLLPGMPVLPNAQPFSAAAMGPLKVLSRVVTNPDKPKLTLRGALRCAPNRFGPQCSVECRPTPRFRCRTDGSRECLSGWTGPDCDQADHCASSPCRPYATCKNLPHVFACECDGRTGPQCEGNGDPCFAHLCRNGAKCVAGGNGRPSCQCAKGWLGIACDRRDPCTLRPCGERGSCSILYENATLKTLAGFECDCYDGYSGLFCKNRTATTAGDVFTDSPELTTPPSGAFIAESSVTTAVIVLLSLIVACCFATGLVLLFKRRRRRRKKLTITQMREPVYRVARHAQSSVYDDPESLYEDPDINNPLYMYEEAGEPYSEADAESLTPEPSPALPERVVSISSSLKEPKSPVRFVRA